MKKIILLLLLSFFSMNLAIYSNEKTADTQIEKEENVLLQNWELYGGLSAVIYGNTIGYATQIGAIRNIDSNNWAKDVMTGMFLQYKGASKDDISINSAGFYFMGGYQFTLPYQLRVIPSIHLGGSYLMTSTETTDESSFALMIAPACSVDYMLNESVRLGGEVGYDFTFATTTITNIGVTFFATYKL